jgi:hypothetical protein
MAFLSSKPDPDNHNEAAGLILKDTISPGNGLHLAMGSHGFVQIHRIQTWTIKTGKTTFTH